jgi:spore maturation protein CgeB
MKALGHCPSGRLFEAAACGVPVVSDWFDGIEEFFTPEEELLVARGAEDVVAALERSAEELRRIGARARARALEEHTAETRAVELLARCQAALAGDARSAAQAEWRG